MATGTSTHLIRQMGEYLVAAELGRRGWFATTFTGNLPGFDILAVHPETQRMLEVQVKAIQSASWQLNAGQLLNIAIEDGVQTVRGVKPLVGRRICIFVISGEKRDADEFFVFSWQDLQRVVRDIYKGGVRPRNPDSTHCAVYPKHVERFRDRWDALNTI